MSSKRKWQLLAFVLALMTLGTSAYALFYVSRTVNFSATVTTVGSIQIYEDAGLTTVLTSYSWAEITGTGSQNKLAYLKNEGNVPVVVRWNQTAESGIDFEPRSTWSVYENTRGTEVYFKHGVDYNSTNWTMWYIDNPSDSYDSFSLGVGEVMDIRFRLICAIMPSPESWTYSVTIYASDS